MRPHNQHLQANLAISTALLDSVLAQWSPIRQQNDAKRRKTTPEGGYFP